MIYHQQFADFMTITLMHVPRHCEEYQRRSNLVLRARLLRSLAVARNDRLLTEAFTCVKVIVMADLEYSPPMGHTFVKYYLK